MATAEDLDLLGPFSALSYEIILHILGYVDGLDLIEWAVRASAQTYALHRGLTVRL